MPKKTNNASRITNNQPIKIVIDARHFGPSATGIGRYTAHLLGELQKLDGSTGSPQGSKNEYVIFLQKSNIDLFRPTSPNFSKKLVDAPIYSVKEQLLVPKALAEENPDLAHFPHFNVPVSYFGKFVVTIHDLIVSELGGNKATTLPLPLYWIKRLGYNLALRKAIFSSQKILVPSKFVKGKILARFKIPEEKIVVTYEAGKVSESAGRTAEERKVEDVVQRFRLTKPFFLYVGNVYPHKNVSRLLGAVGLVKANLVIVSPRNFFLERLEKEIVQKRLGKYVRLLGLVSDVDLVDLYKEAEALVHPSLSEGFGLPPVEAMALGCPAVLADASSLPEIGGEAALYFDPYDPKDMAEKMARVLGSKAVRQKLIRKGLARAKKFSWEKMARETLRVYESVSKPSSKKR